MIQGEKENEVVSPGGSNKKKQKSNWKKVDDHDLKFNSKPLKNTGRNYDHDRRPSKRETNDDCEVANSKSHHSANDRGNSGQEHSRDSRARDKLDNW